MIRYDELRTWFWWRTWMWSIPCTILTTIAVFWRLEGQGLGFNLRFWDSVWVGVGSVAIALLVAGTSTARPWMRFAWKSALPVNTLVGAVFAGVLAFLVGGIVLGIAQNSPPDQFIAPDRYRVYLVNVSGCLNCVKYGVLLSALWGAVYGAWFALRRDKYFIEPN
jgi:hypothetical protein